MLCSTLEMGRSHRKTLAAEEHGLPMEDLIDEDTNNIAVLVEHVLPADSHSDTKDVPSLRNFKEEALTKFVLAPSFQIRRPVTFAGTASIISLRHLFVDLSTVPDILGYYIL